MNEQTELEAAEAAAWDAWVVATQLLARAMEREVAARDSWAVAWDAREAAKVKE
jgi:hypothetical protein